MPFCTWSEFWRVFNFLSMIGCGVMGFLATRDGNYQGGCYWVLVALFIKPTDVSVRITR